MEKMHYDNLYTDIDMNTGEDIFYIDKELKNPFTGVIVDYFKGKLSWEFDSKSGFRDGKEKKFYDTGELMEENDVKHNAIDGIAKEFYRNGQLKTISIVIRNTFIDTMYYDDAGNYLRKNSIDENDRSYFLIESKIDEYRNKYKIS